MTTVSDELPTDDGASLAHLAKKRVDNWGSRKLAFMSLALKPLQLNRGTSYNPSQPR